MCVHHLLLNMAYRPKCHNRVSFYLRDLIWLKNTIITVKQCAHTQSLFSVSDFDMHALTNPLDGCCTVKHYSWHLFGIHLYSGTPPCVHPPEIRTSLLIRTLWVGPKGVCIWGMLLYNKRFLLCSQNVQFSSCAWHKGYSLFVLCLIKLFLFI